jgi:hypothetical protein
MVLSTNGAGAKWIFINKTKTEKEPPPEFQAFMLGKV